MENDKQPKPKNFEEAALSHIPPEFLRSMAMETGMPGLDGLSSLEVIMREKSKAFGAGVGPAVPGSAIPAQAEAATPQQKKAAQLAVDGFVIEVPGDKFQAGVTMLTYIFARMARTDKKIAKILDQFRFSMYDVNGEEIYAPKRKKK